MLKRKGLARLKSCLVFFLTAVVLAGSFPAGALEPEEGVRADKTVTVLNEKERSFRLDYRVWSEDWVSRSAVPCDVILLLDVSREMSGQIISGKDGKTRMESVRKGTEAFLKELGEISPDSRAGLVLFGEDIRQVGPVSLDEQGREKLLTAISNVKAEGDPDYTGALEQARQLTEQLENPGSRPLYLVTMASGLWAGDAKTALPALQVLRDNGAKSYTALLCASPEEETEDFWQAMSSVPLSSHHYLCGAEAESCLRQICRDIAAVLSVEVVQRLDPRFDLTESEQSRLRREGAHLNPEQDGSWTVSWEAGLPRRRDLPWKASLTVKAKESFPGGNDVITDGEGTGIRRAGEEIASLPETSVNVPLNLTLEDLETELFLGERVRATINRKNVEEIMAAGPAPAWFGKGQTGSFSYLWETEKGSPVGSLKQLELQQPKEDVSYRLRVTYRPGSDGLASVGVPIKTTEKTALYKIRMVSGAIRIKGTTGSGAALSENSSLLFRLEKEDGEIFFRTAVPEADPESGRLSLQGELTGLPYGTYTVVPVSGNGVAAEETMRVCRLGVWEKDDTVSPERNFAQARFTLRNTRPWENFLTKRFYGQGGGK